jgi:ABC-2 type transport system permease protein
MNTKRFATSVLTVAEIEVRKIRHDSSELWTRVIQPALWLLVFGEVFNGIRGFAPTGIPYLEFITPGILAQSVQFIAIFYGITIVWEKDVGLLTKLLSTPSPRSSIIVGKALAAGFRGIFQAIMIFGLALIIGVHLRFDPLDIAGTFFVIVLFAMCFTSLSMALASFLKTRERMMGIGQAITMPLFFASNAIYPIALMPKWLQYISMGNPLTYVVDALRAMLLTGDYSNMVIDLSALMISTSIFIVLASMGLRRLVD